MSGEIKVGDCMTHHTVSVTPETEILRVAYMLAEHRLSGVAVVDEGGTLQGILTEKDCIRCALEAAYHSDYGGVVADFMVSPVEVVSPEDGIVDAARRFLQTSFHCYPVVEEGRVVGLLTRQDVLGALARAWQWR